MELDFHTLVCLWMLEQGLRVVCSVGYTRDKKEKEELCSYIQDVLGMRCFMFSGQEVVVMASPLVISFDAGAIKEIIDPLQNDVLGIATQTPRFGESYESFVAWAKLFGYPRLSRDAFGRHYGIPTLQTDSRPLLRSTLMVKMRMGAFIPASMIQPLMNTDLELLTVCHEEGDAQHDACLCSLRRAYQKLRGQTFTTGTSVFSFAPNSPNMPEDTQFYWITDRESS